jgi:perosamine synthetase
VQLSRIGDMLALREAAAKRYDALLAGISGLERPPLALPRRIISWFVYVVRLPEGVNCDRVQDSLARQGIATGRYFAPIHLQVAQGALQMARRVHRSKDASYLALTESISRRTLALPFFNRIAASQQQEVADALREAFSSHP